MRFNTHSELGSKGRIAIPWTFSRKEYTIQDFFIPQIRTAWLQAQRAPQCACAHVRRAHFGCRRSTSPQCSRCFVSLSSLSRLAASPSWKQYVSDPPGESKCSRQKKGEQKEPPFLVSPVCGISGPSHLVRPGEGFLHPVLPTLCRHKFHGSAISSNTRPVRKVWQISNICHLRLSNFFSFFLSQTIVFLNTQVFW